MTSPGIRAFADAHAQHIRDQIDADNPLQVRIVAVTDWDKKLVRVSIDGNESVQPFAPTYTPNPGEIAWMRGAAGSKIVTDKVGGTSVLDFTDAATTEVGGNHQTDGNATVKGTGTYLDRLFGQAGATLHDLLVLVDEVVLGSLYVDSGLVRALRVAVATQLQADTVGCNTLGVGTVNASQVNGNCSGIHSGDCNGNHNGTNYGDQRGNCFAPAGTVNTDPNGNMHSLSYYGGTFYGHGQFDNNYAVAAPSSRHLKQNIVRLDGRRMLDEVIPAWEPAAFDWNHDAVDWPTDAMDDTRHVGLIVDPIVETVPDACRPFEVRYHNHPFDVDARAEPFLDGHVVGEQFETHAVLGIHTAAMQALREDRDELREQVALLTEQLGAVAARLDVLEASGGAAA